MNNTLTRAAMFLSLAILLVSCGTTAPTNYYLLGARVGAPVTSQSPSLGIGPIEIPEYLNRKGPYVGANLSEGVSIVVVYELDNSKLADGMDFIANFYTNFFGVPGFKYQITPHFDVAEGLKMLGM